MTRALVTGGAGSSWLWPEAARRIDVITHSAALNAVRCAIWVALGQEGFFRSFKVTIRAPRFTVDITPEASERPS